MIEALLIPLVSYHFNAPDPAKVYNEVNPGVVAELDGGLLVGAYYNSHKKVTALAGKRLVIAPAFSVVVAACTGYKFPVCGYFGVRPHPNIEVSFVPRIGDYNAACIAVAWRQPL